MINIQKSKRKIMDEVFLESSTEEREFFKEHKLKIESFAWQCMAKLEQK